MDDPYVIEWGADGTGYLRRASFATPPAPPRELPTAPADEEIADGTDEPFAYGRAVGGAAA